MEPRQQIEEWQRQAAEFGDSASANMAVTKRLMKHGVEALDKIDALEQENTRLRGVCKDALGDEAILKLTDVV